MSTPEDPILCRIDQVLLDNRRTETIFISLAVVLFLLGIGTLLAALITNRLLWATPSAVTTGLLYWPMRQIRRIRRENIALATAPALISRLPAVEAAAEIQRMLEKLFRVED